MFIRGLVGVAMLAAVVSPLVGCATQYRAKAIEGHVVDADTHQPLAGVNVIAHWVLEFGLEGGSNSDLQLMETVTDDQGRYSFPAWGPLRVPRALPMEARLKDLDPELIYFKAGYKPGTLHNDRPGDFSSSGPELRTSDWDGKTISLNKFTGPLDLYEGYVSGLLTGVSIGNCGWQRIPRAIIAISQEADRLEKNHIVVGGWTRVEDFEGISRGTPCADVRGYLSRYRQ